MVSLVPSFSLADQKVELIFLVDRSGSMGQGYDYQKNEPTEGSIGELCGDLQIETSVDQYWSKVCGVVFEILRLNR